MYLADGVAHEVKKPGTVCYEKIVELLGTRILSEDGEIHKKRMAEVIFADQSLLAGVNAIVHPAVKEYLLEHYERAKQAGEADLFFVEAALLIECGYGELVDEMWYIYARREVRAQRLQSARGYAPEKIARIMEAQLSEEQFRAGSNFVIDNSGALEDTHAQIRERLRDYTFLP